MLTSLRTSNVRLFALAVFHVLYLIIGAAIFVSIEGPEETLLKQEIVMVRDDFKAQHKHCIPGKCETFLNLGFDVIKVKTVAKARERHYIYYGCLN